MKTQQDTVTVTTLNFLCNGKKEVTGSINCMSPVPLNPSVWMLGCPPLWLTFNKITQSFCNNGNSFLGGVRNLKGQAHISLSFGIFKTAAQ